MHGFDPLQMTPYLGQGRAQQTHLQGRMLSQEKIAGEAQLTAARQAALRR